MLKQRRRRKLAKSSIFDWLNSITLDDEDTMDSFGTNSDNNSKNTQRHMLKNGWKYYSENIDLGKIVRKFQKDPLETLRKTGEFFYELNAGMYGYNGNKANGNPVTPFLYLTTQSCNEEWNEFIQHFNDLSFYDEVRDAPFFKGYYDSPLKYAIGRRILDNLGKPDKIVACSGGAIDKYMYFPIENYTKFEDLVIPSGVYADFIYGKHTIIRVNYTKQNENYSDSDDDADQDHSFVVKSKNLSQLIQQATYGLAALDGSGRTSQIIGEIQPSYELSSFPQDLQDLVVEVEKKEATQSKLNVLLHGVPGTMKTSWCLSYAYTHLVPKGYFIFILNAEDVSSFYPPAYMSKICLIINEVDRMALNRQAYIGQGNTEKILALFDGTLYTAIKPLGEVVRNTKIVSLMTANVLDALDPAFLRKGRIDITHEAKVIHPDVLPEEQQIEHSDLEISNDSEEEDEDDYMPMSFAEKRVLARRSRDGWG